MLASFDPVLFEVKNSLLTVENVPEFDIGGTDDWTRLQTLRLTRSTVSSVLGGYPIFGRPSLSASGKVDVIYDFREAGGEGDEPVRTSIGGFLVTDLMLDHLPAARSLGSVEIWVDRKSVV